MLPVLLLELYNKSKLLQQDLSDAISYMLSSKCTINNPVNLGSEKKKKKKLTRIKCLPKR